MRISNTSKRLIEYMDNNDMRQVDLLNRILPYAQKMGIKIDKSYISQYVSGKAEPNQEKLALMSEALGVNEAWLMGYDIEPTRQEPGIDLELAKKITQLSPAQLRIVADLVDELTTKNPKA